MKRLNILHINDVHGYIKEHDEYFFKEDGIQYKKAGGYARIKQLFQDSRDQAPTLALDGGDTFHGTKPVVQSKGEILIPILNHLGLDGMTGHWDFAYGPKHLMSLVKKLNFPFLASNVYDEKTDELVFDSHFIKEVGDAKVLVIGLAATIIDKTMPSQFSEGIYLTDGLEEVKALVEKHRSEVDLVVVNSHMGYPQDVYLASQIDDVDVWLSAHTHNRLAQPTIINETILIQSGSHGSFVGKLELEIDQGKVSFNHKLIELDDSIQEDISMRELINDLDLLEEPSVVGQTEIELARNKVLNSELDYLLLESVSLATQKRIVFSNGWRYGPTLLKGDITKDDVFNIIPTDPFVMFAELTGKEIKEMLEDNIEKTFSSDPMSQMGGFVKRVYGLKVYFKIENPKGYRIQSIMDKNGPIVDEQLYEVAYLTQQGVPRQFGINHVQSSIKAIKAVEDYLKDNVFKSFEESFIAI